MWPVRLNPGALAVVGCQPGARPGVKSSQTVVFSKVFETCWGLLGFGAICLGFIKFAGLCLGLLGGRWFGRKECVYVCAVCLGLLVFAGVASSASVLVLFATPPRLVESKPDPRDPSS